MLKQKLQLRLGTVEQNYVFDSSQLNTSINMSTPTMFLFYFLAQSIAEIATEVEHLSL